MWVWGVRDVDWCLNFCDFGSGHFSFLGGWGGLLLNSQGPNYVPIFLRCFTVCFFVFEQTAE